MPLPLKQKSMRERSLRWRGPGPRAQCDFDSLVRFRDTLFEKADNGARNALRKWRFLPLALSLLDRVHELVGSRSPGVGGKPGWENW